MHSWVFLNVKREIDLILCPLLPPLFGCFADVYVGWRLAALAIHSTKFESLIWFICLILWKVFVCPSCQTNLLQPITGDLTLYRECWAPSESNWRVYLPDLLIRWAAFLLLLYVMLKFVILSENLILCNANKANGCVVLTCLALYALPLNLVWMTSFYLNYVFNAVFILIQRLVGIFINVFLEMMTIVSNNSQMLNVCHLSEFINALLLFQEILNRMKERVIKTEMDRFFMLSLIVVLSALTVCVSILISAYFICFEMRSNGIG